jgi:cytochrome c553
MTERIKHTRFDLFVTVALSLCALEIPIAAHAQFAEPQRSLPAQQTPPWAYPLVPPDTQRAVDDGIPKQLPGSNAKFTITQLRDLFAANDWYPGDHPSMPEVVARGRKPNVYACGMCHMPNGQGRPENASLAGLPAAYIVQQMAEFKSGARKSSEPNMRPPSLMVMVGQNATEEEVRASAEYFASMRYRPWIRVVESKTAPKTQVTMGSMLAQIEGAGSEPLGNRIIETAIDLRRTELRDPKSGFIAYVPIGSIKQGKKLVTTGGGKTIGCATCHGPDLNGAGLIPRIAGRSPSYIVRQLYDMQSGARAGTGSLPMKEVVAKLSLDDMIAIAAYTASRVP